MQAPTATSRSSRRRRSRPTARWRRSPPTRGPGPQEQADDGHAQAAARRRPARRSSSSTGAQRRGRRLHRLERRTSRAWSASKLPLFVGVVVLLSALLLLVVFRSVVIPIKAAIMNLLSIGAALGFVTLIFQDGHGAGLLGIGTGPIESFVPVLMFAIVFGLSMDYEVFLDLPRPRGVGAHARRARAPSRAACRRRGG